MHNTNPGHDEGPTARTVAPLEQHENSHLNCAGTCVGEQAPQASQAKRLSSLQAKFCLAGWSLYPLASDDLLVTKWGMHRTLPSLEAAEAFLRQVGGAR